MERHRDNHNEQRVEREPIGTDPYIVLEDGLITNDPALPVIDLVLLKATRLDKDVASKAASQADTTRSLGLDDIAERLDAFADEVTTLVEDGETDTTIRETAARDIVAAEAAGTEITTQAAQNIALGLVRLQEHSETALARFARTGEGDYLELREEYLDLYEKDLTTEYVKEWINWLGTYLVQRDINQRPQAEEAGDGAR